MGVQVARAGLFSLEPKFVAVIAWFRETRST